ncbi:H(+)-transporting V0 sector ATPase subunit d [Brettanomyces nanus]|uniref:V-type proton ATPase subunit n=1 Tax=Eeniella nana TaxID=13502 RepID=A0A875SC43_EENNA|nr:H(+)-transporting V0 sector ATPase subunit d [Brettanomyces nanus]QPG77059.1 H(+)-transporting V0 sector ATPase subunit d [Brettanomyces nanus]
MEGLFFNINDGFIEAVVRGYKNGLLSSSQYVNLTQCDTLEDLKLQLSATDYGNFLSNVSGVLSTSIIESKLNDNLVSQFRYLKAQASEPLSTLMDYISYGYMIDNVALMITGTVHERDRSEMLERCHPLGWFDTLPTLSVATDLESLYETVLVDTPLAPYFHDCLSVDDLDDMNIEIIRNTLFKAYLEDFSDFAKTLSSPSDEVMCRFLAFEADKRSINICVNSLNTELTPEDKLKMMPGLGRLSNPAFQHQMVHSDDLEQLKIVVNSVGEYKNFFDESNDKSMEDHFYEYEMTLCKNAFTQQFTYSTIWAFLRSKEQEIRNIAWISECISQNQKDRINNYIAAY